MAFRTGVILQLGPISTQVNIESAIEREESLKTICAGTSTAHTPTAVKQSTACPECQNGDYATFKKASVDHGTFVIAEQAEVADVREQSIGITKDIIALTAHPIEELRTQTIQNGSVYYLTPYKPALAALYAIIRDTLARHSEFGFMGLWTPQKATALFEVRLFGDTLVMEGRARTETIKIVQQPLVTVEEVNQQQIDMLLPTMSKPFDPETYSNTYAASLAALLASKEGVDGVVGEKAKASKPTITGTVDLTALLGGMLAQAGVAPKGKKKVA